MEKKEQRTGSGMLMIWSMHMMEKEGEVKNSSKVSQCERRTMRLPAMRRAGTGLGPWHARRTMRHLSRNIYHLVKGRRVDRYLRWIDEAHAASKKLLTIIVEGQGVLAYVIRIANSIFSQPFFNVYVFYY